MLRQVERLSYESNGHLGSIAQDPSRRVPRRLLDNGWLTLVDVCPKSAMKMLGRVGTTREDVSYGCDRVSPTRFGSGHCHVLHPGRPPPPALLSSPWMLSEK